MSSFNRHSILVLIPAYNAEKYLDELVPRCLKYVCDSNLLLVNDGSTDDTLEVLRRLGVKYISFSENRGKGAALMAGFEYAIKEGYRSVLTIDADLQHLPEEIPRFFALDNGRRLIVGTRHMTLKIMPLARWLTNNLTSMIISIFSTQRVRDSQSGFRLIPTDVLRSIPLGSVRYDFESEMLFSAGAAGVTMAEVPISTVYEGSHSYINPFVDTGRFVRQIWKRIWA
ncbi:MAG: glycosyltransferase family 2 protein [candidate division Zixibacteria bacterium]|nr:glycosyltransferase family 2 protein [candidate division Zixibacteria bacterium]